MSYELMKVEFESLSGISVMLDADTVRKALTRGNGRVSDQEVAMFLRTCQAKRLDPFETGEVHLIKYDDKAPAQLVMGYFAYIRRAERFPDYRGFTAGITVIRQFNGHPPTVVQQEGQCVYKQLGDELIGGWCRVKRERVKGVVEETFVEVSLEEYSTGKSNWAAKPATMIRKVAISQAFRAAFPNEFEGIYTMEEMQASGAIPGKINSEGNYVDIGPDDVTPVVEEEQIVTKAQRQEMFRIARQHFGESANDVLQSLLAENGITSTEGMPVTVYEKVMTQLVEMVNSIVTDANAE